MLLLLFIPLILGCFDYNLNECVTHNCLFCMVNGTEMGYCISDEFYKGALCNQTCCGSVIRVIHQKPVPWVVIGSIIVIFLAPIVSLICITVIISVRSCKPCYDVV